MSRYATCPHCGHRMNRVKDMFGYWDGESYICYHCSGESEYDSYDDDDDEEDESISVWEAAQIWASNGKDEDYMFGYTEEELEDAL